MKKLFCSMLVSAFIVGTAGMANAAKMSESDLSITGVAQFGYAWSQRNGADDGMNLNRLRIKLGAPINDNIDFKAELEAADSMAAGSAFGDNTPANANIMDMGSDSRVVDMYVVLKYLDWASICVGQLATPVSYELQTDVADLETINYSQFVGIANRDRGVGINIPFKNVNARLAAWVLNGTGGINGAVDDIDDRSTYGAMFEMTPVEPLSFKVFANMSRMSDNTGLFAGSTAGNLTELNGDAYGAGINYKSGPVHLSGEYVQVKLKETDEVLSTRLGSAKTREWYVHGSYMIPDTDVQLVARYDKYDPATATANDDSKITTVGLNWNFDKDARLQIMREFNKGADNDDLDVQLTIKF